MYEQLLFIRRMENDINKAYFWLDRYAFSVCSINDNPNSPASAYEFLEREERGLLKMIDTIESRYGGDEYFEEHHRWDLNEIKDRYGDIKLD